MHVSQWLIKYISISRCRALRQSAAAGSNSDNFDELTWFLPRQEGSQQGRWGLLPRNPTLESSHNLKGRGHTCNEQHLQSKQPQKQSTGILHLHSGNPWIPQVFLTAFDIDALSIMKIKANNGPQLSFNIQSTKNNLLLCQQ